jgi:hypothetical protein
VFLFYRVLGTLVKNNMIPDPFYGLENENIIDIADSGREYYTFWFFKEFDLPLVSILDSRKSANLLANKGNQRISMEMCQLFSPDSFYS